MRVRLVTAKRFNSIFKQIVGYRKHNDLRTSTFKTDMFYEDGVGLRESETWFYMIPTCAFLLVRRLNYDNRIFKLGGEFYRLHVKWLMKELEPYIIEKEVIDSEVDEHLRYINKHGVDVWKYVEQTSEGNYLMRFYQVQEELQSQT